MSSIFFIICTVLLSNLMCTCLLPLVPPLIGTILRLLQHHSESRPDDINKDEQLLTLAEITTEFLSDVFLQISKVFPNGLSDHFINGEHRFQEVVGFMTFFVLFFLYYRRRWQVW